MRSSSKLADSSFVINQLDVVRILEGGVRSLNNILEKFHQSYFFYLLPHSNKFISIAFYMPSIVILLIPVIILALREWTLIDDTRIEKIAKSIYFLTKMHLITLALYWLQSILQKFHFVIFGLDCTSVKFVIFGLFLPMIFTFFRMDLTHDPIFFHCLRFLMALEFILLLLSISLINFPLSIIICLYMSPLVLSTLISDPKSPLWRRTLLFLLLNPFVLSTLTYVLFDIEGIQTCVLKNDTYDCVVNSITEFTDTLTHFSTILSENHFWLSSNVFFVLSLPSFSLYLISTQIINSK